MKKVAFGLLALTLLSSCFVFRKKEKYGCPNDARNRSQEEIVSEGGKKKYKGGDKFKYK